VLRGDDDRSLSLGDVGVALGAPGGGGATISVPRDSILSVERATLSEGHAIEGAVVGGVAGAVVAWLIGSATERCDSREICLQRVAVDVEAAAGGLAGLVVGGVIGSRIRADKWQPIDLRLTVRPEWRRDQRVLCITGTAGF
jgi:uncharacterized protein YcfJ